MRLSTPAMSAHMSVRCQARAFLTPPLDHLHLACLGCCCSVLHHTAHHNRTCICVLPSPFSVAPRKHSVHRLLDVFAWPLYLAIQNLRQRLLGFLWVLFEWCPFLGFYLAICPDLCPCLCAVHDLGIYAWRSVRQRDLAYCLFPQLPPCLSPGNSHCAFADASRKHVFSVTWRLHFAQGNLEPNKNCHHCCCQFLARRWCHA